MNSVKIPDDCSKQWEIILLLLSSEEKKIDRTGDTEIDTMQYFCGNEGVRKILLQWLQQMQATYAKTTSESDTALKCDDVSLHWRQCGNEKFRGNQVDESYYCYSKSVVYAHKEGPMYPLALANRSASLLRLKKYKECLSDISLALDAGYPVEQRHKLLVRRADCLAELGHKIEARAALEHATKHADTLKLSAAQLAEFNRHVKIIDRKLEQLTESLAQSEVILPECLQGENPDFIAASKAVELKRNETCGRFVVTSSDTKRGDVLFSEEPYAWVALPSEVAVCEDCCQPSVNAVPCDTCSRTVYCSESCRVAAVSYHKWECVGAQSLLFPTIGIAHLALRVLLITARDGFPPSPTTATPSDALQLFASYSQVDNIKIYKNDVPAFYRMFNLVTNFDKMNNTDYIQYALTATMLTLYLENFTSFFDDLRPKFPYKLSDHQLRLFASALLLRSMGQLVCNGHATLSLSTVEEDNGAGRTVTEREVRRATAIYPSAAMMNHSCEPNIINTFYKRRLLVRSGQDLSAGLEVSNCYGPQRSRETTGRRRAALRAQYMFTCCCRACTEPEHNQLQMFSAYLCQQCKGAVSSSRSRCPQCKSPLSLSRTLATLDHADDLMAQADRCDSVASRCEKAHAALRLRQQVLHKHHTELRAAADTLARLYADIGEFSKSIDLLKQNIPSLEYQFGSFSVEVAHELRKLSDVMLERIIHCPQHPDYRDWCLETHKIIKKAVQLTDLNYGSWEPLVHRLKEQEALVATVLAESRTPDATDWVHHNLHYNLKI